MPVSPLDPMPEKSLQHVHLLDATSYQVPPLRHGKSCLTRISIDQWGKGHRIISKAMGGVRIALCLQGQCLMRDHQGRIHHMKPGHLIINTDGPRDDHVTTANGSTFLFFLARPEPLRQWLAELDLPPGIYQSSRPAEIEAQLRAMWQEAANVQPYTPENLQDMAHVLLRKIATDLLSTEQHPSVSLQRFDRCRAWIWQHAEQRIKPRDIAEAMDLDPAYLSRLFKRYTGAGPQKYIDHLRMRTAAQLLTNTEDSVQDIAYEMGYDDPFIFSKAFKKIIGMAPQHYRHAGDEG